MEKFIELKCIKQKDPREGDDEENKHHDDELPEGNDGDLAQLKKAVLEAWEYANHPESEDLGFDISWLDEDKMMTHMLDCYAALCAFQQYRADLYRKKEKKPSKLYAKIQQAKNKTFKTAMSLMSTGIMHEDAEQPVCSIALSKMILQTQIYYDDHYDAFPDDEKWTDGRGWMPLHWAALALGTTEGDLHGLTEEDAKILYASDPLALQRYHSTCPYFEHFYSGRRYTPAHFLCMQPVTTSRMSLLRYFSICNQQAFTSTIPSVLHSTCEFGQPTEELLQHLLQLDSSQVTKRYNKCTPLRLLCQNDSCNGRLMACLLDVDSSAEVVAGGILGCVNSSGHSNVLEKIDVLLKANPEATKHHFRFGEGHYTEQNVLHVLANNSYRADIPSSLCITIMQQIHAIHPDAVKEMCRERYNNQHTYLPVHIAAIYGDVEVMDFLLGLYPDSATIIIDSSYGSSQNLLHLTAIGPHSYKDYDAAKQVPKVRYLCTRYPAMMHQRDGVGKTPLHHGLSRSYSYDPSGRIPMATIMLEIGGQELTREPTIHPTDTNYRENGWLPLHYFTTVLSYRSLPLPSKEADLFRLMLRWYPEAAGIEGGSGARFPKQTPYQVADSHGAHPYYLRLLLRAAPDVKPARLHRLNYAERRMAMFLAFTARAKEVTPLLLARLRFENKDLLKRVVSFL